MSLERLLEDGVIDEVVGRVKTGKEAEVWMVRRAGEYIAAKVYRERDRRNFKHNAAYTEGRQVRSSRTQRAIEKGSRFGRNAAEDAWKSAEADALEKLFALGVHVPQPVMFYEGVLLMEFVIDPEGHPAPRLVDATIPPEAAAGMYARLRQDVVQMLCADLIHGDLSAFNVLLAWNGPTVIDFPQVMSASHNSRAEFFLKRDVENLRRFFAGIDPTLHERSGDADEIWRAHVRRELTPDFVPSGRPGGARPPRHGQGQGHPGHGHPRQQDASRGSPGGSPRAPQGSRGNSEPRGPGPRAARKHPPGGPRGGDPRGGRPQRETRKGPEVSYRGQAGKTASAPASQPAQRPPSQPTSPQRRPGARRRSRRRSRR